MHRLCPRCERRQRTPSLWSASTPGGPSGKSEREARRGAHLSVFQNHHTGNRSDGSNGLSRPRSGQECPMPLGIRSWSGGCHAHNSYHRGNVVSLVPPHPDPCPKGRGRGQARLSHICFSPSLHARCSAKKISVKISSPIRPPGFARKTARLLGPLEPPSGHRVPARRNGSWPRVGPSDRWRSLL